MASGEVGRLSIRVLPDTTQFRRDLKKALDRAEKAVTATIDTELRITKASMAAAKRQLEGLQARIPATVDTDRIKESAKRAKETAQRATEREPVTVPAQMGDLDRKFLSRLKAQAEKAAASIEAQIPATVDGEGMRADLQAQLKRLERQMNATIPVEPEKAAGWRAELQRMVDEINDQKGEIEANVDLDHGAASAQVAAFTRPRILPINVSINKASLAKATAAIAALSGARVLRNFGRSIKNAVANLDQALPAFAAGATAISNLSAAALAGTSNILGVASGLASIAPAALALPGIFAGFGIGLGVTVAALSDAGKVLKDLGPQFSALQDSISANFWKQAEGPIRSLAETALPVLKTGLSGVATELGRFFGSFANALSSADNMAHLGSIIESVRSSIDIAGDGIAHFTDAMMGLLDVGASFLPKLASSFNIMSEQFSGWVDENTKNGNIFRWIDTGVQALQSLGSILASTGGILSGFATAAANAGGAGLGDLAAGLKGINDAVNGPVFQGALTTVFEGAHQAMQGLGPGVSALGDAFVKLAPTIKDVLTIAGQIGGTAFSGIAAALETPALQGGIKALFEGILVAVQALAPHMPALASAFGSVASFAGTLAAVLGPVLGTAIGALAPVVSTLMSGLSALAPVLGGALITAIQAVAPLVQTVVNAIVGWVRENPGLAATIGVIVAAIGPLIAGAGSLIAALLPVVSSIIGVVTAIAGAGGLSAVIATVSAGLSGFIAAAAPVIAIVAAVAAGLALLVGAFVYAWQTSEQFRNSIMQFGAAIMTALQPVIAFITGTVVPVAQQIAGAFMGAVTQIMTALTPLMTVVVQIATALVERFTPVIEFIMSVLAPVFTHLGTIVSGVFTFLGTVISQAINVITSILQVFLAVIQGDWAGAWAALQNVASTVWAAIQAVIGAAVQLIVTTIQSWLATAQSVWTTVWGAISSFASSIWSGIVSAITGFISSLVSSIVNFVNTTRSNITNGFNAAKAAAVAAFSALVSGVVGFISNLIGRIVSFVSSVKSNIQSGFNAAKAVAIAAFAALVSSVVGKIGELLSEVKALPGKIKSGLGNLGSLLVSAGKDLIRGLINGIKEMAGSAVDAAKGVASDAVNGAKNLLGIHSPSTVFAEIGSYTVAGLVKGLNGSAKDAAKASANLAKGVVQEFQKRGQLSKKTTLDQLRDRSDSLEKKLRSLKSTAKSTRANRAEIASLGKELEKNDAKIKAVQRGDVKALAKARAEGFFRAYAQNAATQLENLAKTREQLTERIKKANKGLEEAIKVRDDYASSMTDKLGSTFALSSDSKNMGIDQITASFKNATSKVASFYSRLKQLRKQGLDDALIDQIAQLGAVDGGVIAGNLLEGSKSQIKQLNTWFQKSQKAAATAGSGLAQGLYGAGVDAARGLANGLKSQLKAVNSAAATLANQAVSTVRKKLKIHSPSRVFMELGSFTGQGLIAGLEGQAQGVSAAMSALVQPPALPTVTGPDGSAVDLGVGLMDLSPESVEALADAMLRRPFVIGNRQAGMLAAAGATSRRVMGGSW